jgi:hypothetical protein
MFTQSFTPARSTTGCRPAGRPSSAVDRALTSGVISFAWLKWRLIHSGWYFSSISHSSSSIRWGRKTGTRDRSDDLDVRDLAEAAQDRFEELRAQGQAVAAGDQDVADLRRAGAGTRAEPRDPCG